MNLSHFPQVLKLLKWRGFSFILSGLWTEVFNLIHEMFYFFELFFINGLELLQPCYQSFRQVNMWFKPWFVISFFPQYPLNRNMNSLNTMYKTI